MQTRRSTPLHHLVITLRITRDIDDLSTPTLPRIFQQLNAVRSTTSLLRVPENHPFGLDVFPDESGNRGSEGALLIRAYPDQEPIGALDTC